ncbi:secretion protein [Caulobacter sp. Root1455]|uniref:CAP domain-containing protein n=1 Tax=Caulobacter sp. Root1455 TaxID=1736465 RepID=UPI0006FCE082|nr:CAP domain-containing protein [Caulobacter sp. Root1455]KQY92686.1 secretion protein [Caulobacter sp. Root1455]
MNAPNRRTLIAATASALVTPCLIPNPARAATSAPWLAYDRRLRRQLAENRGDFDPDFEIDLHDLGDIFRRGQGLSELAHDPGLTLAARAHAADVARTSVFDHMTREGFGPAARVGLLARDLIGAPGENIAERMNGSGAVRPDQIMGQWKGSAGHRANLLAPGFTHVGYGVLRQGREVLAVGAYAEVSARLAAPAPLRVASVTAIAAALSNAVPRIDQFSISEPGAEALIETYVEAPGARTLPPGAWQLRPHLSTGARKHLVAWGPVFVLG